MKLNKFFMLGLVGLTFAACSNEEADNLNKKDGDKVLLTLSLGKSTASRAASTSAAGLFNNVKSMSIHFYASSDRRVEVIRTPDEQAAYEKEIQGAIDALNASTSDTRSTTIAISGVPEVATQVLVVMNENTPISTGNLTQARETNIRLAGLVEKADENCVFNQQNSLMTGLAPIGVTNDSGTAQASVSVTPVSSRLEIKKLTAIKSTIPDAMNIENFTLEGIYINRFYTTGSLDPTYNKDAADRTKTDFESTKANYSKDNYTNKNIAFMCDEPDIASTAVTGDAICEVVCPNGQNWGFPVLAGKQEELEVGIYDVANIVVKLSVKIESVANPVEKYLTIVGYKRTSDNSSIQRFERRNVYIINDLQFSVDDLTDVPYQGTKTVEASVTVLPWIGVPVEPEFN